MHLLRLAVLILLLTTSTACSTAPLVTDRQSDVIQVQTPSVERLSDRDIATVKAMLNHLQPYIKARTKAGNQALLTFDELYQQLDPEETRIVR